MKKEVYEGPPMVTPVVAVQNIYIALFNKNVHKAIYRVNKSVPRLECHFFPDRVSLSFYSFFQP